ncbi:hypothetical protein MKP05_17210 [Halomonas sp. EGI 63088]|uniref:Uncharacterized protein n=1 Tax=Halomonas flagellata TaxID=2920385 RepID=A0ABS9RY88_9GAMM|nr:hypothetical protein [Halomonas flagellata]MCH4564838.1 hypothetical protein [Halomonas flagellata]
MDPVMLRAIERILVVLFAGMAIYLGYRLFLAVPAHRDSDGKVTLPGGTEVVLNRAAPGLFFALFGSVALGISLYSAVQATSAPAVTTGDAPTLASYSGLGQDAGGIDPALEQAQLRRLFFTLNALGDASSAEGSQAVAERGDLRQVKLRLMRDAWLDAWGDHAAFSDWANGTDARGEPPDARFSEPAALYHQGRDRP